LTDFLKNKGLSLNERDYANARKEVWLKDMKRFIEIISYKNRIQIAVKQDKSILEALVKI
jgi:hypothetical protein